MNNVFASPPFVGKPNRMLLPAFEAHVGERGIKKRRTDRSEEEAGLASLELVYTKRARLGEPTEQKVVEMRAIYLSEREPVFLNSLELHVYPNIKWIKAWGKEGKGVSLQEFIYGKLIKHTKPQEVLREHHVMYLSDSERARYAVAVDLTSGRLVQGGKSFKKGRYIFALLPDGSLYSTEKFKCQWGRMQHSSLTRGGPVSAAGWLGFDTNGHLKDISNFSGHYHCKARQMFNILNHLAGYGLDLSSVQIVYSPTGKPGDHENLNLDEWIVKYGFSEEWADLY